MIFKPAAWYMTLMASLGWPPLFLVTGIPLAWTAVNFVRGARQVRRENRIHAAEREQQAHYDRMAKARRLLS